MQRLVSGGVIHLSILAALLLVISIPAPAQNAGFDLFQTGSGTSVTLPNIGTVNLQGVTIPGAPGNTDTIIQRTQDVPSGGGTVNVSVYALFMKSTAPVNFNGSSADVYVTINNSGGAISTSALPQPDSLSASSGTLNVSTGGTFDSSITVNADIIFVNAGASVTDSANILGSQAAPPTSLSSTNSSWSTTPPAGYPSSTGYPSGGFYPVVVGGGGHSTPTHVHAIVPAVDPCRVTSGQTSRAVNGKVGSSNTSDVSLLNCITNSN